ncbi:uroporphyrinogen-III C-methyltransferase [Moritella sp. Urea-trap-13]|uniref:uroporphyrinogen-III C-methyltransferase n=1 Tax=Moritella sp. Urea-trap-13 TaxID=2058327 RepID=UPI000C337BA9|nr:uroporphyrinogen-III C-methyltransferase [Moritella sp. Urea-trap-13]PKH05512.1 uroporphyrinogen-III C-methyltransferase [Moritella sp. Urea-trap-13]
MTGQTIPTAVNELQAVSHTGKVILVGSGPGDPDLLTVKALRLLQQAEVVVHDRLVSDEIIALIHPDAECFFVGKQAGYHCVPQSGINDLLVKLALQGKQVIRLKGGDPFIFGRGGEELEALLPFNIPFEVVPGITAASGCAAYAGIPLTHRDYTQGVQFITGHLKDDAHQLDWPLLGKATHTLVFYMGLTQSSGIASNLIEHGMDADMPVAIVEKGTSKQQRTLRGSLKDLSDLAAQAESPSLIIIGGVTQLASKLDWFSATLNTSE